MNCGDGVVYKSLNEAISMTFGSTVTIENRQVVHGGDANDAYALMLSDGKRAFLKENTASNADFFRAEAEDVAAIGDTDTLRVPTIHAYGTDGNRAFLLMEYIERKGPCKDFWDKLGCGLAMMHKADTSKYVNDGKYGFKSNNYIGAGKQKNTPKESWIEFFSECRLRPQFKLAEAYFDMDVIKAADRLMDHLDRFLFEPEFPSLLHGDLWAGNFMSDENGEPMLIDPAVYVGCSEADIAMTELFGGFDKRFYVAYFDSMGKVQGYEDRRDLYNLYHLLNHLNLFGIAYLPAVVRTIREFE
ncbi:fructosamine kinase family protein [Butyrivibrio sp. FC2001]|uniref:fructosamine kinase family protein n=1 Tax=Butyrivibrio sp. FC2001 TaxID=1280671 RepID=UPI0006887C0F|nr:fructosamine kinase family protein [Butyrivibrio sp. FC2001]